MHRPLARVRSAALLSLAVTASALALVACSDDEDGDTATGPGASSSSSSSSTGAAGGEGGTGAAGAAGGTGGSGGSEGGAGGEGGTGGAGGASSQSFHIDFAARVGAEPFACGQVYAGVGTPAATVTPVDMKMYVTGVKLVKKDGSGSVPLELEQDGVWQYESVALLDFEDATDLCAGGTAETNTTIHGTAPAGEYLGLELTVGVPADLNHTNPTVMPSPLNFMGLYWSWAMGRIYWSTMFQEASPEGTGAETAVHFGAMNCAGDPTLDPPEPVTCANANAPVVSLPDFDPASSKVIIDVAALLGSSDLAAGGQCHSFPGTPFCDMPFEHAGVNYDDGSTMPGQTVFSVE